MKCVHHAYGGSEQVCNVVVLSRLHLRQSEQGDDEHDKVNPDGTLRVFDNYLARHETQAILRM